MNNQTVKIISYNVEFAKMTTPDDIADFLRDRNADIICFSEVPSGDWTSLVGEKLDMPYCYVGSIASANHMEDFMDKTGNFFGKYKSILSKTPLFDEHEEALEGCGWSPVSVVFAKTRINNNELLIGSLHIPSGVAEPENCCARHLADLMDSGNTRNFIICGDYNDTADSAPMKYFYDKGFKNAWFENSFVLDGLKTWNTRNEMSEGVIDHFIYSGSLKSTSVDIIEAQVHQSDHYAIEMDFII